MLQINKIKIIKKINLREWQVNVAKLVLSKRKSLQFPCLSARLFQYLRAFSLSSFYTVISFDRGYLSVKTYYVLMEHYAANREFSENETDAPNCMKVALALTAEIQKCYSS